MARAMIANGIETSGMAVFSEIYDRIVADPFNDEMRKKQYAPVYTASSKAKIIIVGQAPGIKAQSSLKPWDDKSGENLRLWLDVSEEQFYDPDTISLIPMDFFYPGKGKGGDLPPRKGFAEKWHPLLLEQMPNVELIILIGAYSQKYYLGKSAKKNLTETVHSFREYLPKYFPLVHSSPLNFRWQARNPWFLEEVVPELQKVVKNILRIR